MTLAVGEVPGPRTVGVVGPTKPGFTWACLGTCGSSIGAGHCSNCKSEGVDTPTGLPNCRYCLTCCLHIKGDLNVAGTPYSHAKPKRAYTRAYSAGDLENWGSTSGLINVKDMDDGHLMNTMRFLQEKKMPPCWPKMVHEAKKRGLNWVPEYKGVDA